MKPSNSLFLDQNSFGYFELLQAQKVDATIQGLASDAEFFAALVSWMKPKYPSLAGILDTRPEKWLGSIQRIRELCEQRGIVGEAQFPYVVKNLFPK